MLMFMISLYYHVTGDSGESPLSNRKLSLLKVLLSCDFEWFQLLFTVFLHFPIVLPSRVTSREARNTARVNAGRVLPKQFFFNTANYIAYLFLQLSGLNGLIVFSGTKHRIQNRTRT